MLTKKTIGLIGAGNMAEALIKGLIGSKLVSPGQIVASDMKRDRLLHLAETYEIKVFNKNYEVAQNSDIIFLSVKPNDLATILCNIAADITPEKLLISIAAGKTTDTIQSSLKKGGLTRPASIIRAMPNTPALVGEGTIGVYRSEGVTDVEFMIATTILSAIGEVFEFTDEDNMNAVTGLSGSGPAYVFLFIEALAEAGAACGIGKEDALSMALKTTLGAARLASESTEDLGELIARVSSPGGTTVEGLKALNDADLKGIIASAVEAATRRSKELSE